MCHEKLNKLFLYFLLNKLNEKSIWIFFYQSVSETAELNSYDVHVFSTHIDKELELVIGLLRI